jgi:hypothetical protein
MHCSSYFQDCFFYPPCFCPVGETEVTDPHFFNESYQCMEFVCFPQLRETHGRQADVQMRVKSEQQLCQR